MLENTGGAIKNLQSRETGNAGHKRIKITMTQYVLETTIHKQAQIMNSASMLYIC